MSCLSSVNTDLGRIELHHEGGSFDTRSWYTDAISGERRETVVPVFEGSAREWYELAQERGAVYAPFPEAVAS